VPPRDAEVADSAVPLRCSTAGDHGAAVAQRTPPRTRRETAIAWVPGAAALHLMIFTIVPAIYAIYLASRANSASCCAIRRRGIHSSRARPMPYTSQYPWRWRRRALAVHRYGGAGRRLLRAAFLLPYVSSVLAVALLWQAIYRAGVLGWAAWMANQSEHRAPGADLISIWVHVGGQMLCSRVSTRSRRRTSMPRASMAGSWPVSGVSRCRCSGRDVVRIPDRLISALQMFTLVFVLTQGGPFPLHATDVVVHRSTEARSDHRRLAWQRAGRDARRGSAHLQVAAAQTAPQAGATCVGSAWAGRLVMVAPFLYMLSVSFMGEAELLRWRGAASQLATTDNYAARSPILPG